MTASETRYREPAPAKARRYLADGRLIVTHVSDHRIEGRCRGDTGVWECGWTPPDGWWCECPSPRRCSHLIGLRLVTATPAVAAPTTLRRNSLQDSSDREVTG